MSTRLAHVHLEPELLIAIGLDSNRMYELGTSIEFWFGSEREVYVIDKPAVVSNNTTSMDFIYTSRYTTC